MPLIIHNLKMTYTINDLSLIFELINMRVNDFWFNLSIVDEAFVSSLVSRGFHYDDRNQETIGSFVMLER